MANELLDFVMSLVRDPDAAARYAADPAGTIADAHLTDVTSADVNNLIPVVSESLSTALPLADPVPDGNVWTSGAAVEAFDAFAAPVPEPVTEIHSLTSTVIDQPLDPLPAPVTSFFPDELPAVVDAPVDAIPVVDTLPDPELGGFVRELDDDLGHGLGPDTPALDFFD